MIKKIINYFKSKRNLKIFNKILPYIIRYIKNNPHLWIIEYMGKDIIISDDVYYKNKKLSFILSYYDNSQMIKINIIYDGLKLYKKYDAYDFNLNYIIFTILLLKNSNTINDYYKNINERYNYSRSNYHSTKTTSTTSTTSTNERLQKLQNSLESYNKQLNEILIWEKANKCKHQDKDIVNNMIINIKDKIEKVKNKS